MQQLFPLRSPRAFKYHATSRFINDLCSTVSDNSEYLLSCRIMNLEELKLIVQHQRKR